MNQGGKPLVSVKVPTYLHEKYLAKCLEGILMQRTDFPYEVIVGEDGGADGTRAVAESYRALAPDRVIVLPPEPNLGPARNALRLQKACRGKYQAMCEGDDYWIDPLKLQTQVRLMEANPAVSACFHNAFRLNLGGSDARLYFKTPPAARLSFGQVCDLSFPVASILVRSAVVEGIPAWRTEILCGDVLFRLWCAHSGIVAYLDEIMSVYRPHAGGLTATLRHRMHEDAIRTLRRFDEETGRRYTEDLQRRIRHKESLLRKARWGRLYYAGHPRELAEKVRTRFKKDF